ncbi:MAG: hypothetical protein JSU76_01905 [Dehalococcoidia bacterium]|nr:MAG: hypothetical protein JSU76_01905 [Dehalococcoidia bacterium]
MTRRVNDTLIMRQKTSRGSIAWRLLITLILAVCLIAISSSPVFALDFEDYLTLDYDIELSKTDVSESGVFYAIVEGTWTCKRNMLLRITEGYVIHHVVAEHQKSGTVVTLNPGYTINVEPFPDREGESTQFNAFVLLDFPAESEYGIYDVEIRIIEGKINTEKFGWLTVTSSLPSLEVIGTVTYASTASSAPSPVAPVNEADEVVVEEAPAAFTTSDLSIAPTEVDMGEEVTISVLVTNTGDLSGSYEVTLNIDGTAVATEEVTLAGGASERVTFTTTQDTAGRYSVTIDGLLGTFDVKLVPIKVLNWWAIAIIAGATAAIAVPLVIRRRRRA